jgi:hypothetical protein
MQCKYRVITPRRSTPRACDPACANTPYPAFALGKRLLTVARCGIVHCDLRPDTLGNPTLGGAKQ